MIVIGINAYHGDASACLVRDGEIVAAAEEERFRRIKHWAGFPAQAIRYCLKEAGVGLEAVEHVAVNSDPKANLLKKIGYALKRRPDLGLVLDRIRNQKERQSVEVELAQSFPDASFNGTVHRVEHHFAHLASCFLVSPFEEAVTVSVDGFGDFSSAAWGVGKGSHITVDGRVYFPHSLGIFYQAMTQHLGFPHYGDEYKVMGFAPYGEPRHLDAMRRIVRLNSDGSFSLDTTYFRHHKEKIDYEWSGGSPVVGTLYSDALTDLLGPARQKDEPLEQKHRDIARSVQAMYEEAFFHLLDTLHAGYRLDSLTLAGGCAMNSVANGKVRRQTRFKRLYVQSAAGDAGGAIGAAIAVWHKLNDGRPNGDRVNCCALTGDPTISHIAMDHAYWGPASTEPEIRRALEARDLCYRRFEPDRLTSEVAKHVADGKVVGWFQGRTEWGPRALGNRSIVADPRRTDMKDVLNRRIKHREPFRPFAPSILEERLSDWFEGTHPSPFMLMAYRVRPEKRELIPAPTHVDGTGRLQTVSRATNPLYWSLIHEFEKLTGVPVLLNTSFNENEPVVNTPEEAIDCFLRTKMDTLAIGPFVVERAGSQG